MTILSDLNCEVAGLSRSPPKQGFDILNFRDEAEMEYLKIAQDLEMYGVNYFQIKVIIVTMFLKTQKIQINRNSSKFEHFVRIHFAKRQICLLSIPVSSLVASI